MIDENSKLVQMLREFGYSSVWVDPNEAFLWCLENGELVIAIILDQLGILTIDNASERIVDAYLEIAIENGLKGDAYFDLDTLVDLTTKFLKLKMI